MNPLPCLLCVVCVLTAASHGVVVNIPALKDATLYQSETGHLANGGGDFFFAGRTQQEADSIRRGVIEFDIQSFVPAGAVINSATLTLQTSTTRATGVLVSLHRLTREWNEGTSDASGNEGGGTAVTGNDVTWLQATSPGTAWTGPGAAGDFIGAASGSVLISGPGAFYSWTGMESDVQGWLTDAGANHGWILIGDESIGATAVSFASRTNPNDDNRPVLRVDYTAIPEPHALWLTFPAVFIVLHHRRRLH
jgi:hypothetical protein